MGTPAEKRVFLDIAVDSKPVGRIEIKLFTEDAPKTCENFRALCTGEVGMAPNNKARLHYKGNQIHRVVKKFMIQGGDITEGDGRGGYSIYGRYFDDEKFTLKHTKPYLLSMANKGSNSNSSQFFITTAAAPHCNGKHVVFGEVIRGQQVVDLIENLEVDSGSKPNATVEIVNCGELVKKQKKIDVQDELNTEGTNKQADKNDIPEAPKSWLYRPDDNDATKRRWRVEGERNYSKGDDRNKHRRDDRRRGRRDDSREDRRRYRRDSSRENRRFDRERDRKPYGRDRRRRSESRSRSREPRRDYERYDRRDRQLNDSGVKVRGRGGVRFRKERSLTPIHWKKNAPTKYASQRLDSPDRENKYIDDCR